MEDPEFLRGAIDTGYVERLLSRPQPPPDAAMEAAALMAAAHLSRSVAPRPLPSASSLDAWTLAGRRVGTGRDLPRSSWRER
jgi:hypothetical protein